MNRAEHDIVKNCGPLTAEMESEIIKGLIEYAERNNWSPWR